MRKLTGPFADKDYKLFESNEVAKYGILYTTKQVMKPMQYKALMYLVWKCIISTPGEFNEVSFSAKELAEALGYCNDAARHFARDAGHIMDMLWEINRVPLLIHDTETGDFCAYSFIDSIVSAKDGVRYTVRFARTVMDKYFSGCFTKGFTVVRLKYLNRLKSTAAVLLYPFFCRYKGMGTLSYSIEELVLLLTQNKDFEYKVLKRRHLIPAIEDINEYTDLHIAMKENKKGKKVTSITFTIYADPAADEKWLFMEENDLHPGEFEMVPYNEKWQNKYDYDMGKQEYVVKSAAEDKKKRGKKKKDGVEEKKDA